MRILTRSFVLIAAAAAFSTGAGAATPAELAVQAVQQYDPAELSFGDLEFVLSQRDASPANKQAADKVWQSLQARQQGGKLRMKLPVLVIATGKNTLDAAISDDSQQAKRADLHVRLSKPAGIALVAGSRIDVIGVLSSYRTNPVVFMMDKGEVSVTAPAAASTH